jgi:hypothetical protein
VTWKTDLFQVFCIILLVWVFFCVPETKGVRIEEMDKLFGGNQGEADMQRIADIRRRLGITGTRSSISEAADEIVREKVSMTVKQVEG